MQRLVINGGKRLKGEINISGAKNAVLPILAATILNNGQNIIDNVPQLQDVKTFIELLRELGLGVENNGKIFIDSSLAKNYQASYDLVKKMRASILVLGPLLARFGRAKVSLPGGCAIGERPINLHLSGLEKLGAKITLKHGYIDIKAKKLKGAEICLDIPTVTGTENLVMAACLAEGTTKIENAACEPEVIDLVKALNKMGAKIKGAGTNVIIINGVTSLGGINYSVMSDRIEAGTFMIAAAITGGELTLRNCFIQHLEALVNKLRDAGVTIISKSDKVIVKGGSRIKAVDVKTTSYPGFPTDMQAQIMSLMTLSEGLCVITETVFENRFMHAAELKRMGANIIVEGNNAVIKGVPKLSGAQVMATDLRASASLVLAGLAAEGKTEISKVYHIDRGYEQIEQKLSQVGADIERIKE